MSDDSPIYDPDALEAAERAVREAEPDEVGSPDSEVSAAHIDEPWVRVASAAGGDVGRSLEAVFEILREAGIHAGFDPYRPGEASSPYGVLTRVVSVVVPQSLEKQAHDVLRDSQVVIPGEPALPDAEPPERAQSHSDSPDLLEGRTTGRPSWRLVIVVVVILLALAVFLAGLATGPFLGR